jgi:hypothetical protein
MELTMLAVALKLTSCALEIAAMSWPGVADFGIAGGAGSARNLASMLFAAVLARAIATLQLPCAEIMHSLQHCWLLNCHRQEHDIGMSMRN